VGDYFKAEAIAFAWEILTKRWGIPEEILWITVFRGEDTIPEDQEAITLWTSMGVPSHKIFKFSAKDNFWGPPGATGPCGPCSEIHCDLTGTPCHLGSACGPNCECNRFIEVWNLVFMQYNKTGEHSFEPLPARNIDTGMGLERIAMILQGKEDIFSTDLFYPIIEEIKKIIGCEKAVYDQEAVRSLRIIADHIRGSTFLVSDGVLPSNDGRGYVLRRILRRALVHARKLGYTQAFLPRLAATVIEMFKETYTELEENRSYIFRVIRSEEERFLETLETGMRIVQSEIERLHSAGRHVLPGELVFKLYDTYGFPVDLTADMAQENGFMIDRQGFEQSMDIQREKARASWKGTKEARWTTEHELSGMATEFLGYDRLEITSTLTCMFAHGKRVDRIVEGEEGELVTSQTPLYAESGGQVGDQGTIEGPLGLFQVLETAYGSDEVIVHKGKVLKGELREGHEVLLRVDRTKRLATARNHSCTHLLQYALRQCLGDHVKQSGSLVAPERFRFDFTHFSALDEGEMYGVETLVNDKIRENCPVDIQTMPYQRARDQKAIALFGEKYGDTVRVVGMGDFSRELCGGTHVRRTGDIGLFKILHESSVAAGVRRIEALTGEAAIKHFQDLEKEYRQVSLLLQSQPGELTSRIHRLIEKQKVLEKQVESRKVEGIHEITTRILARAKQVGGITVITAELREDVPILRKISDMARDHIRSGVILLGGRDQDKAILLLSITKDLTPTLNAGGLIRELAKEIGGSGGGRPAMAQAGGPFPEKLPQAFMRLEELLRESLGNPG